MVGVPGRSKACITCRQRRIACSLERPQCAQCIKSNRLCAGYQRKLVFVPHQVLVKEVETITPRAPPCETYNTEKSRQKKDDKKLLESGEPKQDHSTTLSSRLGALPKSVLAAPAYKQQFLNQFICSHIPGNLRNLNRRGRCIFWVPLLLEMRTETRALDTSMLAVSTAKVGQINGNQALHQESLRLYIRGLCELQKALWNPQLVCKDETLAACMALCMYEVLECPQRNGLGYRAHCNGALKLLKFRGTGAHTQGLGHTLFLTFRLHGALQALVNRCPNFLSDHEWLEEPWKDASKSQFDQLVDILLKLPEVFKKFDDSKHLESQALLFALLEIVNLLWEFDADLERWYNEVEHSAPGPFYSTEFSTMESPADNREQGKLFPIAFHFPNLMVANTLTLYWTCQVQVWSSLTHAYKSISTILDPEMPLAIKNVDWKAGLVCTCNVTGEIVCIKHLDIRQLKPLEHRAEWPKSAARNVFQSAEYCLKDEMLGLGANCIAPALLITFSFLVKMPGDWSREFLWVKATLTRIQDKGCSLYKSLTGI